MSSEKGTPPDSTNRRRSGSSSAAKRPGRKPGKISIEEQKRITQQPPNVTLSPLKLPANMETEKETPPMYPKKRKRGMAIEESDSGEFSSPTPEPVALRLRSTRSKSDLLSPSTTTTPSVEYFVGQRLEAQDDHGKWYAARIVEVETDRVLIHFDYWSKRFDEWIDTFSNRLRPLTERPRVDAEGKFRVGDYVLAKWSSFKYYPAKILAVVDENRFNVLFYDGVENVVRKRELRIMSEEQIQKIDEQTFGQPTFPAEDDGGADNGDIENGDVLTSTETKVKMEVEDLSTVGDGDQGTSGADANENVATAAADTNSKDQSWIEVNVPLEMKPTELKETVATDDSAVVAVKRKDKFLTTTQKWMMRQMVEKRSQRKAAVGVALAVAQLTPAVRRKRKTDTTTKDKIDSSEISPLKAAATPTLADQSPMDKAPSESDVVVPEATSEIQPSDTGTIVSQGRKSVRGRWPSKDGEKQEQNSEFSTIKTEEPSFTPDPAISTSSSALENDPFPWPVQETTTVRTETVFRRRRKKLSNSAAALIRGAHYRSCKFKPEWQLEYEWLEFVDGAMYCKSCREHYPNARHGFVKGIREGFLVHRLMIHGQTGSHLAASEACRGISTKKGTKKKFHVKNEITDSYLSKASSGSADTAPMDAFGVGSASSEQSDDPGERGQRLFLFWRNGRESWLRMENSKFFCKACRLHSLKTSGPRSLWGAGIPLNQANNIRRHGQSAGHVMAMQLLEMDEEGRDCATPMFETASNTNETACLTSSMLPLTISPTGFRSSFDVTSKSDRSRGRKRKRSSTSSASIGSDSGSLSTITATETPASRQSSGDRRLAKSRDRSAHLSDREGSTRSSSLSHLAEDDVVRCVCETGGEDGLMLQCEQCMTWQHGVCVGIEGPEAVSPDYICYVCKDPPGSRQSMRYRYEVEKTWLDTGSLPRYPWPSSDASSSYFHRTKLAQSTNLAARTVALLMDRLKASRYLIQQANKLPHGSAMLEKKATMKNEIVAMQESVEKELDALEPFVAELETKIFSGRVPNSDTDFVQSKLAICASIRELLKARRLGSFLQ